MKKKLISILDFMLFIMLTTFMIPFLMIYGAFITPFRYINYVSNKVKELPVKEYYF